MDYLTVNSKPTAEQFAEMADEILCNIGIKRFRTVDGKVEATLDWKEAIEFFRDLYTTGYIRGQKSKPFDIRRDVLREQEEEDCDSYAAYEVERGRAVGKYYFEEDDVADSIPYFYENAAKLNIWHDCRGFFVFVRSISDIFYESVRVHFVNEPLDCEAWYVHKECIALCE